MFMVESSILCDPQLGIMRNSQIILDVQYIDNNMANMSDIPWDGIVYNRSFIKFSLIDCRSIAVEVLIAFTVTSWREVCFHWQELSVL